MKQHHGYYKQLAAALVRGTLGTKQAEESYFKKPLADLIPEEINTLISLGLQRAIPLELLSKSPDNEYVTKIMAVLRGIQPDHLLDVGSKRSSFVWRLMDEFNFLQVTAIDIDQFYTRHVEAMHKGGITTLNTKEVIDVSKMRMYANGYFDVVTALDILPKLENYQETITEMIRVIKRFIIVSVPRKKVENQNYIEEKELRGIFKKNDIYQIKADFTANHLILIGRK